MKTSTTTYELRMFLGITQKELAGLLGCHWQTIRNRERYTSKRESMAAEALRRLLDGEARSDLFRAATLVFLESGEWALESAALLAAPVSEADFAGLGAALRRIAERHFIDLDDARSYHIFINAMRVLAELGAKINLNGRPCPAAEFLKLIGELPDLQLFPFSKRPRRGPRRYYRKAGAVPAVNIAA